MAVGLVLGGGAPNLTLMTGALLALDKAGVEFKVITTTGAGMVVGLLYAAPQQREGEDWVTARRRALAETREWGIDDAIYSNFPINYKIFHKPGKLAQEYSHATLPFLSAIPRDTRRQRLLGDTLAFWAAMMSPSSLTTTSKGLCQPPPWIEGMVDFPRLKQNLAAGDRKFRLSAYCIDTDEQEAETFNKEEISAEHFKAALAMPFIYEPYPLTDPATGETKYYIEGSALQTLDINPENVMVENDIDTIIYFDLMGNRHLIGQPRWLLDAWGKSIVAPLTRIAENDVLLFQEQRRRHMLERKIEKLEAMGGEEDHQRLKERDASLSPDDWDNRRDPSHYHPYFNKTILRRMNFKGVVPEEHWPFALDWSYSNMSKLFDYGVETGEKFVEEYHDRLDLSMRLDPARMVRTGLDPEHRAHRDGPREP